MATQLLPQNQIEEQMLMLNNWNLEENDIDQLTKEIEFETFNQTIQFINKINEKLKQKNLQTPDLLIHSQKILEIMITNYEYEGITQTCIDLAFEIDSIEQ